MAASSSRTVNESEPRKVPIKRYIVEPQLQAVHKATIVWLHDLNQDFSHSLQFIAGLKLGNIKWICLGCTHGAGVCTTPWDPENNVRISNDPKVLDAAAKLVAEALSTEPGDVIKGVGGVGIGGKVALLFATRCALGDYQIPLQLVIGINGWLNSWGGIKGMIESTDGAATRAASQSIVITGNPMVSSLFEQKTADALREAGFGQVFFFPSPMHGHEVPVHIMNMVKVWLTNKLQLDPN